MGRFVGRMTRRLRGEKGFSLIEVLIGGVVLAVGLVMITQFFASAASRVLVSDVRSVMSQVANQQLEAIRSMDYEDVGVAGGWPAGTLVPDETITVSNVDLEITRQVTTWTDSSYSGPQLFNYRRVTITVTAVDHPELSPVVLTTNVAGGQDGGTLDITVTDVAGNPVEDAQLTITNTHLIPNINISSLDTRTDANGRLVLPGLPPDATAAYVVTATKSGYSTASSSPSVLVSGTPYTVIHLTIDQLSNLTVSVVDGGGHAVTGLNLTITGPSSFSQSFVSGSSPTTFYGIRYSTDTDPYIVNLLSGQGYVAQQQAITLNPNSTQNLVLTATAVSYNSSLNLTVRSASGSHALIDKATVSLSPSGKVQQTNNGIVLFTGLSDGTYSLVITKSGHTYSVSPGSIVVTGATSATVYAN